MGSDFGALVRFIRQGKARDDPAFSLRRVARKIKIEPSYLSKIERGIEPPPGEDTIRRLAHVLDTDSDDLLWRAQKIPRDVVNIFRLRPLFYAKLLRKLDSISDVEVLRIYRQVDGKKWDGPVL